MTRSLLRSAVLAIAVSLVSVPVFAKTALDPLCRVPVQEGGRVKPFDTWAREFLGDVYGKTTWEGNPATLVAMSMMVDGDAWKQKPIVKVEHLALKKKCSLEITRKYFTFEELVGNSALMTWCEQLRQSGRDNFNSMEKAALDVYSRLAQVDLVTRRMVPHVVPGVRAADQPWMSLGDLEQMQGAPFVADLVQKWSAVQTAALAGGAGLDAATAAWTSTVSGNAGWKLADARRNRLEVLYNQMAPFHKAWVVYVLSAIVFMIGWLTGKRGLGLVGMFLLWAGFLMHTLGLLTRQYLAGRPPISNLYEALTFVVWGVVFFSILFEMAHRKRVHGTIAAVLGSIGLVLAEVLPIEHHLNPLVAVLRSYWLQYHVTCVLLSYSALTMAAGLAHFHLFTEWFAPHRTELIKKTQQLLYTAMKMGVTFLATGIILGAVWASQSWGRYWGWDPKETWSLITLMGYVAVIHGRFAGWLTAYGTSVANVACWGLVLFTFYGVNYFLVGLHSYAGAGPDHFELPPLLVVYLVFETLVVAYGVWYEKFGKLRLHHS
ncbi:MAG: cytochrome c biogenesis protein CcsA [bacterium]